jgi:hypothetical protein
VPERGKGWFAKGRKKDKTRKRRGEKKQTESNTLLTERTKYYSSIFQGV